MRIADYVREALDQADRGANEPALHTALSALDGTARRIYPSNPVGKRIRMTIQDYLWLMEPMLAIGVNLETTQFTWGTRPGRSSFADVLYDIFRTNLAHGDELPNGSGLIAPFDSNTRSASFANGTFLFPSTIIYSVLAVVVFAPANGAQRIGDPAYYLSHADRRFPIDEWWGRAEEVRPYFLAALEAIPRVTMNF
jgi:hypothetical protein